MQLQCTVKLDLKFQFLGACKELPKKMCFFEVSVRNYKYADFPGQNKIIVTWRTYFLNVFYFRTGARLGKGNGFNDLEWGILCELGVVDDRTKVATTVHDVQVRDDLPHFLCQEHDLPVDIICTPARTSKLQ